MKYKSCVICGNPSSRKYCSSGCRHKGELARKRKLYHRKGKHICVICFKPVTESHRRIHAGECTEISFRRIQEKKQLKKQRSQIIYDKVCGFCGNIF